MKNRWNFCQNCYLNGHCENQDRDIKCETYSKQQEDKIERLHEQLNEANELVMVGDSLCQLFCPCNDSKTKFDIYLEKWGVK